MTGASVPRFSDLHHQAVGDDISESEANGDGVLFDMAWCALGP